MLAPHQELAGYLDPATLSVVVPMRRGDPEAWIEAWVVGLEGGGWIKVMKGAISKNAAYFNSHRMMRRYATEAYIR